MSPQPNPHAELGVPPGATRAQIHQAFRRRLREHHPDTRPQQCDTADAASDQALQRALAAYETLRYRAPSAPVEAPSTGQLRLPDPQLPAGRSGSPGNSPLMATAVHWVPAAGARRPLSHDRTSHGVPWPDWLIRWLCGE